MSVHQNFKWWNLAACRGTRTSLFYSSEVWERLEAVMVCDSCRAKNACLDQSLVEALSLPAGEDFGIRAGIGPDERFELIQLIKELHCPGTVGQTKETDSA